MKTSLGIWEKISRMDENDDDWEAYQRILEKESENCARCKKKFYRPAMMLLRGSYFCVGCFVKREKKK